MSFPLCRADESRGNTEETEARRRRRHPYDPHYLEWLSHALRGEANEEGDEEEDDEDDDDFFESEIGEDEMDGDGDAL